MTEEEKKKIDTAYHEAGHCLCYVLDRRKIKYTTIEHEEVLGRTEGIGGSYFNKPSFKNGILIAKYKALIMTLSGGLAERILYNLDITDFKLDFTVTSNEWNRNILGWSDCIKIYDNDLFSCINRARIPAEERLRKYWYAVDALAKKLLEKPCIPGEEAESIIENAIKEYMNREGV